MLDFMLNQKVMLKKVYDGVDYKEGTIVAVMIVNKGRELEENCAMLKVRIGNMITDWIPESDLAAVGHQELLVANW
jgi:hypothetical protein